MTRRFAAALIVFVCGSTLAAEEAIRSRAEAISTALSVIDAEYRQWSGGSWTEWNARVQPFRNELAQKIAEARPNNPASTSAFFEARGAVLEARGDPPLFEIAPETYLRYLTEPVDVTRLAETHAALRSVPIVSRWLAARGIDLIFVPVPKMTEVYPDRVCATVPPGRLAAPHTRSIIHDLLLADVEVLDLLPLLLAARDAGAGSLYEAADPHWSKEGQMVAVTEIVHRLRRYDFVRHAMAEPPRFRALYAEAPSPQAGFGALNPAQAEHVRPFLTVLEENPERLDGGPVLVPSSPILFIGDSYIGRLPPRVALRLNMPLSSMQAAGQTTEAIGDLVRDPQLLEGRRVVIWIVNAASVGRAAPDWKLPPLERLTRPTSDPAPSAAPTVAPSAAPLALPRS